MQEFVADVDGISAVAANVSASADSLGQVEFGSAFGGVAAGLPGTDTAAACHRLAEVLTVGAVTFAQHVAELSDRARGTASAYNQVDQSVSERLLAAVGR